MCSLFIHSEKLPQNAGKIVEVINENGRSNYQELKCILKLTAFAKIPE